MATSPLVYTAQAVILAFGLALLIFAIYKLALFIKEQGLKLTVSQIAFWLEILGNLCTDHLPFAVVVVVYV